MTKPTSVQGVEADATLTVESKSMPAYADKSMPPSANKSAPKRKRRKSGNAKDRSAKTVAVQFGYRDKVDTLADLESVLSRNGWRYIDIKNGDMKQTEQYRHRASVFRACALPPVAIGIANRTLLTHTPSYPASDSSRAAISGLWVKSDTLFGEKDYWKGLDEQQTEKYGRNYYVDDDGELVWFSNQQTLVERIARLEAQLAKARGELDKQCSIAVA